MTFFAGLISCSQSLDGVTIEASPPSCKAQHAIFTFINLCSLLGQAPAQLANASANLALSFDGPLDGSNISTVMATFQIDDDLYVTYTISGGLFTVTLPNGTVYLQSNVSTVPSTGQGRKLLDLSCDQEKGIAAGLHDVFTECQAAGLAALLTCEVTEGAIVLAGPAGLTVCGIGVVASAGCTAAAAGASYLAATGLPGCAFIMQEFPFLLVTLVSCPVGDGPALVHSACMPAMLLSLIPGNVNNGLQKLYALQLWGCL